LSPPDSKHKRLQDPGLDEDPGVVEKRESMSDWRLTTTKIRDRFGSPPPGWRTR